MCLHSRPSTYNKINTKMSCSGPNSRVKHWDDGGPPQAYITKQHATPSLALLLTIADDSSPTAIRPARHTAHHYAIGKKRRVHWSPP